MDRKAMLRRQIPGAADMLIFELASRPRADVEVIVLALKQARRDALAAQADRRRKRKAEAREHNWYDEAVLAARDRRLLDSAGRRAGENLEALATLGQFARHVDELTHYAVERLRGSYSDTEIGEALGITRQAVGQRFGSRRGDWMPHNHEERNALQKPAGDAARGDAASGAGRVSVRPRGGMSPVDPAQIPTVLMTPAMDAGQPPSMTEDAAVAAHQAAQTHRYLMHFPAHPARTAGCSAGPGTAGRPGRSGCMRHWTTAPMTDQHLAVIVLAALIAGVLFGMAIALTVRYYIDSKKRGRR